MSAWIASLSTLEYVLLVIAVPATLIMVIQTLLLILGVHGGEGDADLDVDGDLDVDVDVDVDVEVDVDVDPEPVWGDTDEGMHAAQDGGESLFAGLKLFTVRGVVAFLAIFGWGGLWLLHLGLHVIVALFLAVAMGIWAMVATALILRLILRLQSDGTLEVRNALGLAGTVYLPVPAGRAGTGKVTVLVQERMTELEAVTDEEEPLPTGTQVVVIGVTGDDILVVTRK